MEVAECGEPQAVSQELLAELVACWVEVTNAGGAAGFPFPPVEEAEVRPVAEKLVGELARERVRLLVAHRAGRLVGWLVLRRQTDPLVAHWGTVHHVQSRPEVRGTGVGRALLAEARRIAGQAWGLEQLYLAARGGAGLEGFYTRLGWREIGRRPRALRLQQREDGARDDRDEVLMVLEPL